MIKVIEETHKVMRYKAARRMLAKNIALHSIVCGNLIRLEAPKIQSRCGVGFRNSQIG